jgi:hypothetical protein
MFHHKLTAKSGQRKIDQTVQTMMVEAMEMERRSDEMSLTIAAWHEKLRRSRENETRESK